MVLFPRAPDRADPLISCRSKLLHRARAIDVENRQASAIGRESGFFASGWHAQIAPDRAVSSRIPLPIHRGAQTAQMRGKRFQREDVGRVLQAVGIDDGAAAVREPWALVGARAELFERGIASLTSAERRATVGAWCGRHAGQAQNRLIISIVRRDAGRSTLRV